MNFAHTLSTYLTLNIMLAIGFIGLWIVSLVAKKYLNARAELELHYSVVALAVGLTFIQPAFPRNNFFRPIAKVWSAPSSQKFSVTYSGANGFLGVSPSNFLETNWLSNIWILLTALLFVYALSQLLRDIRIFNQIRRHSFLMRQIGRVVISSSDLVHVPFSYRSLKKAHVVIPSNLTHQAEAFKISVAHELQHHRQRDTLWVYAFWLLRLICAPNPLVHLWNRRINEIQEFACDETLVDQRKVKSQAYARCLVEVAQTALDQEHKPIGAMGLTFLVEGNLLKRRIEKMLVERKQRRSIGIMCGVVLAALLASAAMASRGLVQDRRVTLLQAQAMARTADGKSDFPIVVNELVVRQLNRYLGTPEGREFIKSALGRLENYRTLVSSKIKQYQLPDELMAIPIVESGYQNLPQGKNPGWGAGLWMFIKPTAIHYGLRVDEQVDERLNEEMLTDAAMRMMVDNHREFGDWSLAVLAYNNGAQKLSSQIEKMGTRDPWQLVRSGFENDQDYLAKVMAAILIVKHPESVN